MKNTKYVTTQFYKYKRLKASKGYILGLLETLRQKYINDNKVYNCIEKLKNKV